MPLALRARGGDPAGEGRRAHAEQDDALHVTGKDMDPRVPGGQCAGQIGQHVGLAGEIGGESVGFHRLVSLSSTGSAASGTYIQRGRWRPA
jgi:hypothetical protein